MAAYAFVLQAMLSGVALSQMAAAVASDLPVVLCAGGHAPDDTAGGGSPLNNAIACAACALCAFGSALDTPAPLAEAAALTIVTSAGPVTPAQSALVIARPSGPRLSQGPPAIV